jgi:HNH endonuclease
MSDRKTIPRSILIKLIKKRGSVKCEICENYRDGQIDDFDDIIHKDGDRTNDSPDNLQLLCRSCHRFYDFYIKVFDNNIKSIEYEREQLTTNEKNLKLPFEQRKKEFIYMEQRPPDEYLKDEIREGRATLDNLFKQRPEIKKRFFGKRFTQWRRGESVSMD